jgi:hypothetical protein
VSAGQQSYTSFQNSAIGERQLVESIKIGTLVPVHVKLLIIVCTRTKLPRISSSKRSLSSLSSPLAFTVRTHPLRDIVLILKETMATEAHGKHGIFTDNFCVFRGFRGYLSRF